MNDSFKSTDFNGEPIATFDPALALGFNINLPFHLSLDARFVYSFTEVVANTNEKNQVIQAGASFRF